MTTVVAALIEREGRLLIAQRRSGTPHALQWEFPGGKVETGETPQEALQRELAEELGIAARIGAEIDRYEFAYPGKPSILLVFYLVREFSGEPENLAFERILWERPIMLPEYDFLAGDVEFVQRLADGRLRLTSGPD